MRTMFVLVVIGFIATLAGILWYTLRRFKERERAEQERAASFLAATAGKAPEAPPALAPAPPALAPTLAAGNGLAVQKLLLESAHKAGEAGEPALAVQLYERLLVRYPESSFAEHARAAVEAQKKKLKA